MSKSHTEALSTVSLTGILVPHTSLLYLITCCERKSHKELQALLESVVIRSYLATFENTLEDWFLDSDNNK